MPITQVSGPAVAIDGGVSLGAPLTIGTNDAQPLIFETSGTERARFTPTGELIVIGPIVTIHSTVVDIADRVFTVNKSDGANDPVPSLMTGLSVYRGAVAGVARDKSVVIWDEPNNRWHFCLNTGGDEIAIGADQNVRLASLIASGNIQQLTNNSTIVGRDFANTADVEMLRVNVNDEVNLAAGGATMKFGGGAIDWHGDSGRNITLHAYGAGVARYHTQDGALSLETMNGPIEIGTTNQDRSVSIATGNAQQVVTLGSTAAGSSLTLDAASSVNIATSNTARTVNIATGGAAQNVTIGSSSGASAMTLRCGSSPFTVTTADNSSVNFLYGNNGFVVQQQASAGGTPYGFSTTFGAHANVPDEFHDVDFNFARTVTFSGGGGAIAAQRAFRIQPPTYAASAAQTFDRAATLEITGAPNAGANVTFGAVGVVNGNYALNVASGASRFGGAVYVRDTATNPGVGGLTVTDSSGNGYRWYQYSPQITWVDKVGSAVGIMFSGTLTVRDTIQSISNLTINIGSQTSRFANIWRGRDNVQTHTGFTNSQQIQETKAVQTTDATPAMLFTSPALIDNSGSWVEVHIVGRDAGGADRGMAIRRALITRQAGGGATIVGTVNEEYTNMPAGWGGGMSSMQAGINVTGNTFFVYVMGAAATTINWVCTIRYQSVSGNA